MATKPKMKNLPPWLKKDVEEEAPMPKHPVKKGKKPTKSVGKKGC